MVAAGAREVFYQFAEIAAVEFSAALAGRTDKADGEPLVVSHRDQRGFAVTRKPLDADLFGVHRFVSLEIIQRATRAPSPGAQRAPVVGFARLAFVAQADDALRQTRAVVGLNAGRNDDGVAPALHQKLLLPIRRAAASRASRPVGDRLSARTRAAEPELHNHGNTSLCAGRSNQRQLNIDGNLRVG